jgi:mono/diheme cytochrome c family protein
MLEKRRIVVGLILAGLLIQVIPYGRDHKNPPIVQEPQWDSPQTRELFMRTCGDCHSHETKWPWYSSIAPISWLIMRDVQEGREHFNVSMWGVQKKNKGDEAAEELKDGEMPLAPYLLMHPEARLSDDVKAQLVQGLLNTFGHGSGDHSDHDH